MGMELLRAPRPKPGDESVADFIQEHYGAEAVDYLAEPCFRNLRRNPSQLSVTSVLPLFVEWPTNTAASPAAAVLAARPKPGVDRHTVPLFRTLKGRAGTTGRRRRARY